MTYSYCRQWFRAKKCPVGVHDEDAARLAHDRREAYTVLRGDVVAPDSFIELGDTYVGVGFLDDRLRECLSYQFQECTPGRLFLTMATHREFQDESDVVSKGTSYVFREDGLVEVEEEDLLAGTRATRQMKADVAGNWESYPEFGEYESLFRIERGPRDPWLKGNQGSSSMAADERLRTTHEA